MRSDEQMMGGWDDPAAAQRARAAALPEDELELAVTLFRLLGDPTRGRLLYALHAAGELCVGDLAGVVGAQESAVSHALRLLRTAGVVAARRAGRSMYYRLADEHVADLLALTHQHIDHAVAQDVRSSGRAAG
ncbi:metalloregulator ArsR/SmtB family transcription factor [Nakamurella sp. A5-74]|uniref:Metalloregulator ArsR/SmtB family transcription factor n=1 Tax=Nakamurella sp. A5-74 TaxID=3158264 RepID=A0AAU8DSE6_9ACTN